MELGATNEDQCKGQLEDSLYKILTFAVILAQCRPGSYSSDGLERCQTCERGFYQSDYAAQDCLDCGRGLSTLFRGATSAQDCRLECLPGTISETGMEPCFPCPRGYFQERNGSDHCFKCPFKTTTLHQASDSFGDCIGLNNYPFKVISSYLNITLFLLTVMFRQA